MGQPADIQKKLSSLVKKARERNEWTVVATASDLLKNMDDLDRQINFVGAMQQQCYRRNRLRPYWEAFNFVRREWIDRCFERMMPGEYDHWPVSALLGNNRDLCFASLEERGFEEVLRHSRHLKNDTTVIYSIWGSAVQRRPGHVQCHPAVELGWVRGEPKLTAVSRSRFIDLEMWHEKLEGQIAAKARAYYFITAALPHGWSMLNPAHLAFRKDGIVDQHEQ